MPNRVSIHALAAALSISVTLLAPRAEAFCRTTTERAPPDFDEGDKCWDRGAPLFWRNACVGFSMQKADGKKLKADDVAAVFQKAATAWTSVSCPGGGRPSIEIKQLASSSVDAVGYRSEGANVNLVVMRDARWPYPAGGESLALTTVVYAPDTGEIFDADIEINTSENDFALTDPVSKDGFDLQTILTHQVGHFLGFAHASDVKSPMLNTYEPGSTARTLQPDDIAGVCTVYAPDGMRAVLNGKVTQSATCDPTPRGGLQLEPAPPESGCSASTRLPSGSTVAVTALAALAVFARRRRPRT
jgi:uncharacterized protein (TIGR03382 family)